MKTVVIGAGAMGRRHIKAIEASKHYSFHGVSDINTAALKTAQDEGVSPSMCYDDTDKMLAATNPECVVVSTTAPTHASLAHKAVAAGAKYLLVEKPFCVSIKQAIDLRAACKTNSVKLAVNHGGRFDDRFIRLTQLSQIPGLGPLVSVTSIGGNMGVAMNASHVFELFRILTNDPPNLISAWFDPNPLPNPRGKDLFDAAGQMRLENASGQNFYINIDSRQGHGGAGVMSFRCGQLMYDTLIGKAWLNKRQEQYIDLPTTRYAMPADVESFDLPSVDLITTTARVLDSMAEDGDYPDGEVGERIIRTLVAAYVSNENDHKAIDIHSDLPLDRTFPWA